MTVDGEKLTLRVTRKRVKNINVRLVGDTLRVSAPPHVSDDELMEAVAALARRLLRRRRAREINDEVDALALARRVARRFSDPPAIAAARFSTRQTARWGSFNTGTRTMNLNAALRQMPSWVLEAVVAHELAHVRDPNHSQVFWEALRSACPETDRARAFLEGVSWLGRSWKELPPVERSLLAGGAIEIDD